MIWDIEVTYPATGDVQQVRNKMVDTLGAERAQGHSFIEGLTLADVCQIAWRALHREGITEDGFDAWLELDPVPKVKTVRVGPTQTGQEGG